MNRILLCAALALALAACGGEPSAPAQDAATPPAATESVPASAAEPVDPPPTLDQGATTGAVPDGETVEESPAATSTVVTSPVAAAVAANTPAPAPVAPSKWRAGVNYTLLPVAQPVSTAPGEVEVTAVFWYGCGHCFTLEPQLDAWEEKSRPDYVKVVRMPVVWNAVSREDARLFYAIEALGKVKPLHMAAFRELHVNRRPITVVAPGNRVDTAATEKNARTFMLANGVAAEEFDRVYRSFAVENKLRQAENLTRRYLADHTPMVVVHGKYVTDVTQAGGIAQLFDVIGDLAARERPAR